MGSGDNAVMAFCFDGQISINVDSDTFAKARVLVLDVDVPAFCTDSLAVDLDEYTKLSVLPDD